MSEAPRYVYVGFMAPSGFVDDIDKPDKCLGAFVDSDAARETVRDACRAARRPGPREYLLWSSEANSQWTLHVSDDGGTHQEAIARVERVDLERRQPGERRLRS